MAISDCTQKEHRKVNWINDFFCGIHSNIPLCCVLFYCDVWFKKLSLEFDFRGEKPLGYIMCPECVAKFIENKIQPSQIKECNCWRH